MTSRDGQTHVRLEENLHQLAGGLFGGVVGGGGLGVGLGMGLPLGLAVFGSALVATVFPVAVIGLSYVGARQIYRAVTTRRREVMGELFDKILAEVHACVGDRAVEGAQPPKQLPATSTEDG